MADIVDFETRLPYGPHASDALAAALDRAFETSRLSPQDPLKVLVDFQDVEDVGITLLWTLCQKLDQVWQLDYAWYASFSGLVPNTPLFGSLSLLLKTFNLSIACESHVGQLCGVSEDDLMARGRSPYRERDWVRMATLLDYLYQQADNQFFRVQDLLVTLGYGHSIVRRLLQKLDVMGLVVQRHAVGTRGQEWVHILRYQPLRE